MCPWLSDTEHTTPAITEATTGGISFSNAISPGHATPVSMPQIFTGDLLSPIDSDESPAELSKYHETIPEYLSRHGYTTVGYTPNPFTSREFGFDAGFDYFEDFIEDTDGLLGTVRSYVRDNWQNKVGGGIRLGLNLVGQGDITIGWREYYDELVQRVQSVSEPFFLWIFLLEPHWPYFPSSENRDDVSLVDLATNYKRSRVSDSDLNAADRDRLLRLYRNTVKDVDDFVSKLQTDLSNLDPAYVFHSDHGESFGERGYWGHKGQLFRENVHVPLEVWNIDYAETVSSPISLREIPRIVERIRSDCPETIPSLSEPYAVSHNSDGRVSISGNRWTDYSTESATADIPDSELASNIRSIEQRRIEEMRRTRKAASQVERDLV